MERTALLARIPVSSRRGCHSAGAAGSRRPFVTITAAETCTRGGLSAHSAEKLRPFSVRRKPRFLYRRRPPPPRNDEIFRFSACFQFAEIGGSGPDDDGFLLRLAAPERSPRFVRYNYRLLHFFHKRRIFFVVSPTRKRRIPFEPLWLSKDNRFEGIRTP